jgi:tRNA-specific 2-thiouridylase
MKSKSVYRKALSLASNKIAYTRIWEDGRKHQGAHYFTIGQRKGLNVGIKILCLLSTNVETNTIIRVE